jgi:uncharacterized membrane protein YdcZ (DUF606 family)
MKQSLMKAVGMLLLGIGVASFGFAQVRAPEIDPASGINAIALLAGAVMLIRGRKR